MAQKPSVNRNHLPKKVLTQIGNNIQHQVTSLGYSSIDDFWQTKAKDEISKSTLNAIIDGERDPHISTLQKIAELLETDIAKILPK